MLLEPRNKFSIERRELILASNEGLQQIMFVDPLGQLNQVRVLGKRILKLEAQNKASVEEDSVGEIEVSVGQVAEQVLFLSKEGGQLGDQTSSIATFFEEFGDLFLRIFRGPGRNNQSIVEVIDDAVDLDDPGGVQKVLPVEVTLELLGEVVGDGC